MPKHRHGHPHVLPVHAQHGGAHLGPERSGPGHPSRFVPLVAVALAVLFVVGVAVAVETSSGGGHHPGRPAAGASVTPESAVAGGDLQRCRASWQSLHRVLVAARPTMDQWERHVGVMNRLVAGQITLDQASLFWARTRVAAQQRYDAFARQDRSLGRSATDRGCPAPPGSSAASSGSSSASAGSSSGSSSVSAALVGCERAVAAEAGTLAAARTTLTRWSHHIAAMDQLRSGMLAPAMAQQMWQSTWHRGRAELRVYRLREQRSSALRCPA